MIQITQKNAKVGIKVVRGKDWCWNNQDCDEKTLKQTFGEVQQLLGDDFGGEHWIRVKWKSGNINLYRIQPEHDLYLYTGSSQLEFEF